MDPKLQSLQKYWRDCFHVRNASLALMLMWLLLVSQKRFSGYGTNSVKNLGGLYGIKLSFIWQKWDKSHLAKFLDSSWKESVYYFYRVDRKDIHAVWTSACCYSCKGVLWFVGLRAAPDKELLSSLSKNTDVLSPHSVWTFTFIIPARIWIELWSRMYIWMYITSFLPPARCDRVRLSLQGDVTQKCRPWDFLFICLVYLFVFSEHPVSSTTISIVDKAVNKTEFPA